MQQKRQASSDAHFIEADTAWIEELARIYGRGRVDAMAARPEGRGQPGTRLRRAFDLRRVVYLDWRKVNGLP